MSVIGLLGAGGHALEVESYAVEPIGFVVVDAMYLDAVRLPRSIPVVSFDACGEAERETPVVAAVGAPGMRRELVDRWTGTHFARVIASRALVHRGVPVGQGSVVAPTAVIMPGAVVGQHVLINSGAIISHECVIEDFATISPSVSVGGRSRVGAGAFVGIGATLSSGVTIGRGAVIGAGAVVVRDIPPFGVYAGVPARFLRKTTDWLRFV
ncbi:acetyltransferase [Microbacterium kribbense]|uniref:Acetyltransferase n=2 Tax=Microbacterium kribbense TaxID=433645 RepID=A0ABP7GEA5_9MICO